MAGPWEAYQDASQAEDPKGPWAAYQHSAPPPDPQRQWQTPWGSTVELPYQPAEQPKPEQPPSSLGRAAHRIAEAAGEGYYDTPPLFNPDSAPGQWLQRHPWIGAVVNEPSKLLGSANAIIRGGQQAVQEAGEALPQVNIPFAGTPAQLGRDIASIPETLLPEVPHALRERYEAGRPTEAPAASPPPPRPEAQAEQVLTEIASGEPPKPTVESAPSTPDQQAPTPSPPPAGEAPVPAPPGGPLPEPRLPESYFPPEKAAEPPAPSAEASPSEPPTAPEVPPSEQAPSDVPSEGQIVVGSGDPLTNDNVNTSAGRHAKFWRALVARLEQGIRQESLDVRTGRKTFQEGQDAISELKKRIENATGQLAQRREFGDGSIYDGTSAGASNPATEGSTVSTPAGTKVQVQPEVMELGDLVPSHLPGGELNPDYPHQEGLQPRDRTTAASQAQIRSIAANLTPERLNMSPEAGAGAPIVGPDNVVESGNGRTLALGQVYTDPALTAQRDAYRGWLQDQGYDISGMEAPVLVSRRLTDLDPEARRQFVVEANERGTMGMNAAEQARADADRAGKIIDLWRGSDAGTAGNRDFVRGFMQQLGPEERASMMLPDGSLSPEGVRRIQSAVVAHAYGSDLGPVLDRFLMGDSEGMKTLAGALSDAAGPWAQMRAMAARGEIPPGLDITGDLAQAVDTLATARRMNRPVSEVLGQADLDRPPISPNAEAILRMMFRDDAMRKPVGRPILAERLQKYADEATKQVAGPDIFGAAPPAPDQLLAVANGEKPKVAPAQPSLLRSTNAREPAAAAAAMASGEGDLAELGINPTGETHLYAAVGFPLDKQISKIWEYTAPARSAIAEAFSPMQAGTKRAQAYAARFANSLRNVNYQFGRIDRAIERNFTPVQREAMGRAMDAQSVFEQRLAQMDPAERAQQEATLRQAFDASGEGVAGLDPRSRAVVEQLAGMAQTIWQRMRQRELVAPGAEGLPYYFARQILMRDEEGAISSPGGGGGAGRDINGLGRNLTTRGPGRREHLTPEETEAAAQAALGNNAFLLRDIRSVVHKLSQNERAIAGADLVNAIEQVGKDTGVDLVVRGDIPGMLAPGDYFTMNHPSFRRWTGSGFQDIHIAREFEGPLNAVLTKSPSAVYRGITRAQGAVSASIMWSPLMHYMVEIGRAFPAMPGKTLSAMFTLRGHWLRDHPAEMDEFINAGLSPIGQGWAKDPVTIAEQAETDSSGRGRFVQALTQFRAQVANGAQRIGGDVLRDIVQHPHQMLLWERVFDLQLAIASHLRDKFLEKGFDRQTATIMAAHAANRYAGALPPEGMARWANMMAKVVMFSRSFTGGNLGVMKDMFNGAPSHVRAMIEQLSGPEAAASAQASLKRLAIKTVLLDTSLYLAAPAIIQMMVTAGQRAPTMGLQAAAQSVVDDWQKGALQALRKTKDDVTNIFGVLPQFNNEPGRRGRAYVGNDSSGRGVYLRPMVGKVGEEFLGWATDPGGMADRKLSPFAGALWHIWANDSGLGRHIYQPSPQGAKQWVTNAGQILRYFVGQQGPIGAFISHPEQQAQGIKDFATGSGKGDYGTAAMDQALRATGLATVSHGYPGGPETGFNAQMRRDQEFAVQQAIPAAKQLAQRGDIAGAAESLRRAGMTPREAFHLAARLANPAASSAALARWAAKHGRTAEAP